MKIEDLIKLLSVLNNENSSSQDSICNGLNTRIGAKVIIRTYSAGVWFGVLSEKSGKEVILKNARRMYRWHAKQSISLSAVSLYGIKQDKSKICQAVEWIWLIEAIEIIPCTDESIESIEGAENVIAE